jgi:hypothetical protein
VFEPQVAVPNSAALALRRGGLVYVLAIRRIHDHDVERRDKVRAELRAIAVQDLNRAHCFGAFFWVQVVKSWPTEKPKPKQQKPKP